MVSFNKIIPWLSIRSKLIIAFVGLSIVPLVLVGLHSIFSNAKMMEDIAFENLTHDVHTIRENTANFLGSIESDLRVIRHSPPLDQFVASLENSRGGSDKRLFKQVSDELLAFAQTKGMYYQIRIVGSDGDERFRVEAGTVSDGTVDYRSVSEVELRHTRESFYFLLVENLGRDQIAFVPSELLSRTNTRVPVISFAMPLFASKQRVGILIANVFAKNLFRVIETKRHLDINGRVVIASNDGHYLYHSERKKDWNKLLASRDEDNLYHDYPADVVRVLVSGKEGTVVEGIKEIVSYAPLFSLTSTAGDAKVTHGFTFPLFVFEAIPKDIILGPVHSFARTFTGFLLLFLAVAIGLGLLATRQFTRPIAALHRGAEIISMGNYGHRLKVETQDEIEKLANQFNSMAASLESHEREIQKHRTKLEEMVRQRTQELTEQKSRLQAILDHVPSAVVLLDRDFRIQSASAAFSSITGHRFEDVREKDCRSVFFKNGFCRMCVCRQAMATREIQSHIDHTHDPKVGERFIEHIGIPMTDNGEVGSVLEIITDITERKRFEKNLLQAERLATAGEMSAIIAHGFRNSLTSVKMILQLHSESKGLSRSDKKSLSVALSSIEHMESIVTELLNFARPKPMKFQVESLNNIVGESLSFVQPQMNGQGIVVKKQFDAEPLSLLVDERLMKEAVVNVLLNAAHAVESGGHECGRAEVFILTRRERLGKTLRDFVLTDGKDSQASDDIGTEIVLKKGTECALIEVEDNGCGIESNHIRRIFDPFFTTKTNGTGLGLPMVKRTVNAHGGIVTVRSKQGKGTTLRMYLPLKRPT